MGIKMKPAEQLLCTLLRFELDSDYILPKNVSAQLAQFSKEQWSELYHLIQQQAVNSLLADSLHRIPELVLPEPYPSVFQNAVTISSIHCYQAIYLFQIVDSLFRSAGIFYYLLKGLSLSGLYPLEELRKIGDIDIYVPDSEQFYTACTLLKENNFQSIKSMSEHHVNFTYKIEDTAFELELHRKPIARFHKNPIDSIVENYFRTLPKKAYYETSLSVKVPTFEPTINAYYLLLHMLQHFLDSGFGIRLLCDWTIFLKKHKSDINSRQLLHLLHQIHAEHFCYLITGTCIKYLGLSLEDCPWMKNKIPNSSLIGQFLQDLFDGGEFGRSDTNRIVLTTERPSVSAYLHEIHKVMMKRYQRASKIPIFWPFLWILTLYWYFYNNRNTRNTSTLNILRTNKKRYEMFQYLNLFKTK